MIDTRSTAYRSGSPQAKIVIVMLMFLTLAVGFLLADRLSRRRERTLANVYRKVTPRGDLGEDEKSTIALFENSSRSVVHITTLVGSRRRFSMDVTQRPQGSGTGFVWDSLGHIVTNYHVVSSANKFLVTFADHSTVPAVLAGTAPHKDLALLRIAGPASSLQPIVVGESADLRVGQRVFAIGNPFGLDQTLTTGVISGLGREIRSQTDRPITDVVQTDAAINPGNSGGPLLDSAGRLIGVNTAIYSPTGTNDGVGFAIPVDSVRRVIPQLVKYQRVRSPSLGIQHVEPAQTRGVGLEGVLVKSVDRQGAADQAGVVPFHFDEHGNLKFGDLLVGIDATPIRELDDLYQVLDKHEVGDEVLLSLVRGVDTKSPKRLQLKVKLQSD